MKRIILILFISLQLFGQSDNQSQSIELPDFVITGKQRIDLPVMKKSKAEPISLLSNEFFFPTFTPEQFSLATVAKPEQLLPVILPQQKNYNGQLILGAGQYTLPAGEFYFTQKFNSGKFYSALAGINRRDYVDYADYNKSSINLGSEFYVNRESPFLPGAIINVDGKFVRKEYNFYGIYRASNLTPTQRETQNIIGTISLENYLSDVVKYRMSLGTDYIDIKDASATELNYYFDANIKVNFGDFGFLLNGKYQRQNVSKIGADDNYNFYKVIGGVEYKPSRNMIFRAGASYYFTNLKEWRDQWNPRFYTSENLIAPWGEFEFAFNNALTFTASYKPEIEFSTYSDFLRLNPYIIVTQPNDWKSVYDNGTAIHNHKINVALNYGYKKYYELTIGAEYFQADMYPYFDSNFSFDWPQHISQFSINRLNNVTSFSIYGNALYHLGPFGWFYGDAKYQIFNVDYMYRSAKSIPYKPAFSVSALYGYKFNFGISAEIKIQYHKETYADVEETILLDDYINLSAKLRYSLTQDFDFTLHLNNLLNRDNYLWLGFVESPFDITAGIDFRF